MESGATQLLGLDRDPQALVLAAEALAAWRDQVQLLHADFRDLASVLDDLGFATIKGTDPRSVFYLVLVFCALAIYISWRLQVSRLGRAWMAIREDEKVAEAMGINTVNTKLLAFVVGAILVAALALFIDWLARVVEMVASPKGL